MGKQKRGTRSEARSATDSTDWRRLVPGGVLLGAVALVIVVGFVLQAGPEAERIPPDEHHMAVGRPETTGEPPGAKPRPEPARTPPPAPSSAAGAPDVNRRAREDRARLTSPGGDWTLQFLYSCDQANVRSMLSALGAREELYVIRKDDCYRLFWGRYRSRDRAVDQGAAAARVTGVTERTLPKRIDEALL